MGPCWLLGQNREQALCHRTPLLWVGGRLVVWLRGRRLRTPGSDMAGQGPRGCSAWNAQKWTPPPSPPPPPPGPGASRLRPPRALPPIFALYAMPTMQQELLAEAATSPAQRVPCLKPRGKGSEGSTQPF